MYVPLHIDPMVIALYQFFPSRSAKMACDGIIMMQLQQCLRMPSLDGTYIIMCGHAEYAGLHRHRDIDLMASSNRYRFPIGPLPNCQWNYHRFTSIDLESEDSRCHSGNCGPFFEMVLFYPSLDYSQSQSKTSNGRKMISENQCIE
jgi:hypothetical protein